MFLVTAANGNQGKLLVPKLLAAGIDVRGCVVSDASAQQLIAMGVKDVVVGDVSDPHVLAKALKGITKVYHIGPTVHPREREMGFGIVDAAHAEGVDHFVFSSVLHAITTDLVQHEIKRDIEEHLLSSGLDFTILQPANYMLAHRLQAAFEQEVFRLSWSLDRRQSMVDLGDVTDVALAVLTNTPSHSGATYELVGPGRYTAHDLGNIISGVTGKPIRVEEVDPDTFIDAVFKDHDDPDFPYRRRVIRAICARYSSHDFVGNSNVLTWLLGRPPTTFEQFVRLHHARIN